MEDPFSILPGSPHPCAGTILFQLKNHNNNKYSNNDGDDDDENQPKSRWARLQTRFCHAQSVTRMLIHHLMLEMWEFHSGIASSLPLNHIFSSQIMEPRAKGCRNRLIFLRERCSWSQRQLLR